MSMIVALAIVIGALGGAAAWLYLGPLAGLGLLIWATFIAWACFFHCGGKEEGLKNTIVCNIWGAIMASIAVMLITNVGGTPPMVGLWVAITVAVMILGAQVPLLSSIPAAVYGYACVAAFVLLGAPDKMGVGTFAPFVHVAVSMVLGAVLGYVSEKVAGMIVAKRAHA